MRYIVPMVAQTSANTCWHASAQMIWYYWQHVTRRQGPMNTMANNYRNDGAIMPQQFVMLAEKAGLKKVNFTNINYTAPFIGRMLNLYGPLWCAGQWYGVGHIIVLTGVSGNRVFLNDPDGGRTKTETVLWFNNKIDKHVPGCIMYKNPAAY